MSIPFNSAPAHSTRPHNAKKLFMSSFQAKFLKIELAKVDGKRSIVMASVRFLFPSVNQFRGHIWVDESPRQDFWHFLNIFLAFFITEIRPFKVKFSVQALLQCIFKDQLNNSANALLLTALARML